MFFRVRFICASNSSGGVVMGGRVFLTAASPAAEILTLVALSFILRACHTRSGSQTITPLKPMKYIKNRKPQPVGVSNENDSEEDKHIFMLHNVCYI
jgi:hypothetical protein